MRYIVGYDANDRGREAIALAATLARSRGATLEIVLVLPPHGPTFDPYSPDRAYRSLLDDQGRAWLRGAAEQVPDDVDAVTHLRYAESSAAGLIDAAEEFEAGLIVVGAARGSVLNGFTVGSVANALLHSAATPLALAPRGYRPRAGITRITCATGERAGARALVEVATDAAASRGVELRLMSLVALDDAEPGATGRDRRAYVALRSYDRAQEHAAGLAATAEAKLGRRGRVTVAVGRGDSVESAVGQLDFDPGEIVVVGSSRLAASRRTFLGPAAHKMLRALPVPMVVVPRDYQSPAEATG